MEDADLKNDEKDLPNNTQDKPKENKSPVQNESEKGDGSEAKNDNNSNQDEEENDKIDEDDNLAKKSKKLFFCNINRLSELSSIFKVFRSYGEICDILILKDKNGHSLGRGFVEYDRDEDAEKALAELNNTFVDGLKISIKYANPRVHKTSGVEYRQDPKKLDEDMRRKDYRLRFKNDSRYSQQSIRNRRNRSYRENSVDYHSNQADYVSDYDQYDYEIDRGSDRRIPHDRLHNVPYNRERDRLSDRDRSYEREFDRYRDRERDVYPTRYHHHAYNQRVAPSMPSSRSSYRPEYDDRPHQRRSNIDDYDFDYDYERDDHRRRIHPQNHVRMMRQAVQMVVPYPPAHVVYQTNGRNGSGQATSNSSESNLMRVVNGQQQIGGAVVAVRRYQEEIRMQPRGQQPPKQIQDDQQQRGGGYWKDDNYDQSYRRRDRI